MPVWLRRAVPVVLVLVALALRGYRLAELTVFQGDQGIDALAARRLVLEQVFPVEGPTTSAGGVHLGPLYYWLVALPMALGDFDPLIEAALMVVLGALAVVVLFWLGQMWFGFVPAALGAALYAVSPAAIVASRSAWNPAPAPLFVLLALLGLAQARARRDGRWLLLTGFSLGCLIQFHYFALGVVLVVLAAAVLQDWRWGVAGAAVFGALLAPFGVHEVLAGWPNVQAAAALASGAPTTAESIPRRLYEVLALGLVGGFLTNGLEVLAALTSVLLLAGLALRRTYAHVLLAALLGASLLQVVVYRGPIFEHYFVPLAPLLYLLLAAVLALVRVPIAAVAAAALLVLNGAASPLGSEALNHVARTDAVAGVIAARAGAEPFNLWLVSPNDSDAAYRYQLARRLRSPDPGATRLFVVCQDHNPCTPADAGDAWQAAVTTWQATEYDVTVLELQQPP